MLRRFIMVLFFLLIGTLFALTAGYLEIQPPPTAATTEVDNPQYLLHQATQSFSQAPIQRAYGISQTSADPQYTNAEQLLKVAQGPWLHKLEFDSDNHMLTEAFGLEQDLEHLDPVATYNSLLEHPLLSLAAPTDVEVVKQLTSKDQQILILNYKDPASEALLHKTKDQQMLVSYQYQVWLQIKPTVALFKSINFWTHKNPGGVVNTASELYLETQP